MITNKRFLRIFKRDFPDIFVHCYRPLKEDEDGIIKDKGVQVGYAFLGKSSKVVLLIDKLFYALEDPLVKFYHTSLVCCHKDNLVYTRTLSLKVIRDNYDLLILEAL